MPQALFLKPFFSVPLNDWRKGNTNASSSETNIKMGRRARLVCMGMLEPRKFMRKRRKEEIFIDAADEAEQKNWRRMMNEIEETGSAVAVLKHESLKNREIPKDVVLGTLVRFKQLRRWKIVGEILEWLRTQSWWNFSEMDYVMLITAYGKQGDFNRAEKLLTLMNKKGYPPNVVSHTSLMEAYGKGGKYNNAEAIFRRMKSSGPEPSALTYQIILKVFVEGYKFKEAEEIFETLLDDAKSPRKPDQKMFHMMIYMHKKAGSYDKARRLLSIMTERGVPQSTITYNSLMSFETNYKEVSNIYNQMQRCGLKPDVVSYALLIKAYGKARREEEALAVFEEMLDAGVRPTHKAYNILLDAFAISGMVDQATTVFKSMRRDRCTPDLYSYTTMLSAFVNASNMDGAEKFFTRIKQDGLKPNDVTYGTLIKGYARAGNLEKMMEKYEEMKANGLKPTQKTLTMIIDAFGRNRDFESAVVWYREMESMGLPPDRKANNVLLSLAKTPEEEREAKILVGLLDRDADEKKLELNWASKFSDHDDDDEEEDDDGDYDADGHDDFHIAEQNRVKSFDGEQNQESLEALQVLEVC